MVTKKHILWSLCIVWPFIVLLTYASTSTQISGNHIIMPLDDVYIHFQYARALAEGTPYVYNLGEPPTSGATSFIYPFVLGLGYTIGFTGLNLGLWALIVGAVMLGVSMALIILITRDLPYWLSLAAIIIFGGSGAIVWHFQSGMETGIVVAMTLATLTALMFDNPRWVALCAGGLALTRPEGSIMAGIVVLCYGGKLWLTAQTRRQTLWMLIPLGAFVIQPILNWTITGTLSASGNQAKSVLGVIPFDWGIAMGRIIDNLWRMWAQFLTDEQYTLFVLPPLALIGWLSLIPRRLTIAVILLGWFVTVSGAISTLDTAFWHFKRYQMPLIALITPLAMLGLWSLWQTIQLHQSGVIYRRYARYGIVALIAMMLIMTISNFREFLRLYAVNVQNVVAQPLPMAEWIRDNTPPDARIAVHDVGMMRYVGERHTLDMVGLTSPEAAEYWRHGPGAVGEWLLKERPDYVAAYTTARGLNYLVDTPLYNTGEALAGFTAIYHPADNVAVGAEFQGIYRVDWASIDSIQVNRPLQPSITALLGARIADVNVADLESEATVNYMWHSNPRLPGFATEFYTFNYVDCELSACTVTDGGRRITEYEDFTFNLPEAVQAQNLILVTRLHPATRGTFEVHANGQLIATRQIIEQPGQWLEIATYIPAVNAPTLNIRILPDVLYMPYYHWLYIAEETQHTDDESLSLASFQDGAIRLIEADLSHNDNTLRIQLSWQTNGMAYGDYKLFAHVYSDSSAMPVAQTDAYIASGTLPTGNWLKSVISDEIMVDLMGIESGSYTIAIGFYEATTFERLTPQSALWSVDENRLFIGEIDIP